MTNTSVGAFIKAVKQSKLLTSVQKNELLQKPSLFPESYRGRVMTVLSGFDTATRFRYRKLRRKIEASYARLERALNAAHVPDGKKQELLVKAREQIEWIVPTYRAS